MRREYTNPEFVFVGSEEKIALDKALVSQFRKQHNMDVEPSGPIVGSQESINQQLVLLAAFRKTL